MASINNFWNNTYTNNTSFLFNNTSSTTSTSGSSNLLGIDLAEYSSVTKGSYNKLVKAYYKKYGNSSSSTSSENAKDSTKTRTLLKGEADSLYKAAGTLVNTGKDSLFRKVDIKDEKSGTTTKDYDKDKIYKAVNSLISSYNDLVKSSTDSQDNAVLRQTLSMVRSASSNGKLLNDVGIKINSDNTLSLDEETFKNADMSVVKTLFNGSGSFGDRIQTTAGNIAMKMSNSLGNNYTYTAYGTSGSYSTGALLDSIL